MLHFQGLATWLEGSPPLQVETGPVLAQVSPVFQKKLLFITLSAPQPGPMYSEWHRVGLGNLSLLSCTQCSQRLRPFFLKWEEMVVEGGLKNLTNFLTQTERLIQSLPNPYGLTFSESTLVFSEARGGAEAEWCMVL